MDNIGLDLHQRESQLCILTEDGEIVEQRIRPSRERFTEGLGGGRPPARVLLEASTESEWVARHLEALGPEVIVADPSFAPMYATRRRRVKTDRRDARTLAEACRLGAFRRAHRLSEVQRHVRAELAVRDALIRTRTRYVGVIKALVRRDRLRVASSEPVHWLAKLAAVPLPPPLAGELAPLLTLFAPLNGEITAADRRLERRAATDPVAARLATAPTVGPVTATAFVATLDDVTRFTSAHQVEAYLGLTPGEPSSGDQQHRGRITKTGNTRGDARGGIARTTRGRQVTDREVVSATPLVGVREPVPQMGATTSSDLHVRRRAAARHRRARTEDGAAPRAAPRGRRRQTTTSPAINRA